MIHMNTNIHQNSTPCHKTQGWGSTTSHDPGERLHHVTWPRGEAPLRHMTQAPPPVVGWSAAESHRAPCSPPPCTTSLLPLPKLSTHLHFLRRRRHRGRHLSWPKSKCFPPLRDPEFLLPLNCSLGPRKSPHHHRPIQINSNSLHSME